MFFFFFFKIKEYVLPIKGTIQNVSAQKGSDYFANIYKRYKTIFINIKGIVTTYMYVMSNSYKFKFWTSLYELVQQNLPVGT